MGHLCYDVNIRLLQGREKKNRSAAVLVPLSLLRNRVVCVEMSSGIDVDTIYYAMVLSVV